MFQGLITNFWCAPDFLKIFIPDPNLDMLADALVLKAVGEQM
jgi:hypothetical protein